jgi:tetratricopeptide (TPR) repeat protein
LFPILDARHRFQPGDRYDEKYQALVVVEGRERSGEFFPDGRPKSSSFEYQSLVQSKCYLKGQATCLSCHTGPHEPHGPDELKPDKGLKGRQTAEALGDATCKACHAPIFAQGQAHTHHRSLEAQRCVSCHMPKVITGVLDHFADHALDVPVPENTIRHNIPNACGVCHVKEKPEALAASLAKLWPNAAARQVRRIVLADAIDEATAGRSLPSLKIVLADTAEAPTLRGAAADLIGQRFPHDAPAALVPLLHDANPLVRTKALEGLGFANAQATAAAIAPLTRDPSLQVRHMAALVLATFNAPGSEDALRALVRAPESEGLVQPHVMLGLAAAKRGAFDEASQQLERSLELMPYNTSALVMLADVYARQGKLELARERLEEALRFDPTQKGALDRLQAMSSP